VSALNSPCRRELIRICILNSRRWQLLHLEKAAILPSLTAPATPSQLQPPEGKSLKWRAIWWRLLLAVCRRRKPTQKPHHFGVAERPLAMMPSLLLVPPWRSLFSKTSYSGNSNCFSHWRPLIIVSPTLVQQQQQHYSTRMDPSRICKP
jgi:hypothetical protein